MMTTFKPQIICAGRLYCDLIFTDVPRFPSLGTETFCGGLSLHAGGGAFITAATFSALGRNAALLSTLPASPFDEIVLNELAHNHVDTSLCAAAASGDAPQITVAIATQDDRAFLSHKPGTAIPDVDLAIAMETPRHLHIGEMRSLCEHPDLIQKARAAGMSISLDCAWDDELLTHPGTLTDLIARVDVFLPSETEMNRLLALGVTEKTAPLTVVKCGASGARAIGSGDWVTARTTAVPVIDATGAGDAFNGGFVSSWLAGADLEACLTSGNRCGAKAVGSVGGTGGLGFLSGDLDTLSTGAPAE